MKSTIKNTRARAKVLSVLLAATFALVAPLRPFAADNYPSKSIKIIVGFSPAGGTDTIARYYATKIAEVLKGTAYVENKPGAYQMIAIRSLMASPPDGYTLFLISGSAVSQYPGLQDNLPYDPLRDFTTIALVGTARGVIVTSKSLPVKTVRELVDYCKQHPGKVNYGSSGIGSASHLQTEFLSNLAGIKMTHIPYKADAEILTAISGGSVQVGMTPLQGALPAIKGSLVNAIAVTGGSRVPNLPEVPSLKESGIPGLGAVDPYTYYVLVGPKGVPSDVVAKLNAAVNAVSRMPQTISYMRMLAYEPAVSTPQSAVEYVSKDIAKWRNFKKDVHLDLHLGG